MFDFAVSFTLLSYNSLVRTQLPTMADNRFSNLIEETTENSLFVHVK